MSRDELFHFGRDELPFAAIDLPIALLFEAWQPRRRMAPTRVEGCVGSLQSMLAMSVCQESMQAEGL